MHSISQIKRFRSCYKCLSTTARLLNNVDVAEKEDAKKVIENQLNLNLKLPKAKKWSKTAVLKALADTVDSYEGVPFYQDLDTPEFWEKGRDGNIKHHLLRMSGRGTANYVIKNNPDFFQFDWNVENAEKWTDLEGESIMEPTEQLENEDKNVEEQGNLQDSVESLQTLVDKRNAYDAISMFMRLRKSDTEIPSSLLNQFLGVASFYRGLSSKEPVFNENSDKKLMMFTLSNEEDKRNRMGEVLKYLPSPLDDHLMTVMMSLQGRTHGYEAVEIYLKHFHNKGIKLPVDVYNHLLMHSSLVGKYTFAMKLLKEMQANQVAPDYQTFNNLLRILPPFSSPSDVLQHIAEILNEMAELGIEYGPATICSIMHGIPINKFGPEVRIKLTHAVLDFMKGKRFRIQNCYDIVAFTQMRIKCGKDLSALKKLYNITQYGTNHQILDHNFKTQHGFYTTFLHQVMELDTIENLFYYIDKLVPFKIQLTWTFKSILLQHVQKQRRPEYLPIVFRELPHHVNYYETFEKWLDVALELYDIADKDTKTQFKHIAMIELKFLQLDQERQWPERITNSCLNLVLRSEDKEALLTTIDHISKLRPPIKILPSLMRKCKAVAVRTESTMLNEAVRKLGSNVVESPRQRSKNFTESKETVLGDTSLFAAKTEEEEGKPGSNND